MFLYRKDFTRHHFYADVQKMNDTHKIIIIPNKPNKAKILMIRHHKQFFRQWNWLYSYLTGTFYLTSYFIYKYE